MSSGKATIRNTAKHARRATNLRRALKDWIISDKSGGNLAMFFSMDEKHNRVPHFILHKRQEHDKIIGITYFTSVWSISPAMTSYGVYELYCKNHLEVFKNYLDSLGITWFMSSQNVLCVDLFNQELEPKAVKVRTQKPIECKKVVAIKPDSQAIRLMESIDFWKDKKEKLERELLGINLEIRKASKDLEKLLKPYLGL